MVARFRSCRGCGTLCQLTVDAATVEAQRHDSMCRWWCVGSCSWHGSQAKHPQHGKKPSIASELATDLDAPSTDDLAREVYNYTGETGTYRYMAPEVFRHEPYNAKVHTHVSSPLHFTIALIRAANCPVRILTYGIDGACATFS